MTCSLRCLGITLAVLLLAGAAQGQEAEEQTLSLERLVVCERVEDRTPVGEGEVFSSEVGHVYCFTAVVGMDPPGQVFHRWYIGDRFVGEVAINVRGVHWRCWSRKTIQSSWSGPCRVEVLSEEGERLGVQEFTLE